MFIEANSRESCVQNLVMAQRKTIFVECEIRESGNGMFLCLQTHVLYRKAVKKFINAIISLFLKNVEFSLILL